MFIKLISLLFGVLSLWPTVKMVNVNQEKEQKFAN